MDTFKSHYANYEQASEIVRSVGVTSKSKYVAFYRTRVLRDLPSDPSNFYKEKWVSWGEFLGTGRVADIQKKLEFYSYEDAKAYLSTLGFASEAEFYAWAKTSARPSFIPASPRKTYNNHGWVSMGDFLSNGNVHTKNWLPFDQAQEFVRAQKLCSQKEWELWAYSNKRPDNIPAHPNEIYRNSGWVNMPNWLGYDRKVSYGEKIIEFFLKENCVEYRPQYRFDNCRNKRTLPFDFGILIQGKPVACVEFHGIQHFEDVEFFNTLHTRQTDKIKSDYCIANEIPIIYLTYPDLENIVSVLGTFLAPILGRCDFEEIDRSATISNNQWMDFEEARAYTRAQKIPSFLAYQKWMVKNRPIGCPSNVRLIYSRLGVWTNWVDFLGLSKGCSKNTTNTMRSYTECQKWAWDNNIRNNNQWKIRWKSDRPENIPSHPDQFFTRKGNWINWDHFLNQKTG